MNTQLIDVEVNGLELSLFPWEEISIVAAAIEAVYEEQDAKPGLGLWIDEPYDASLDFDLFLQEMRATGPIVRLTRDQVTAIEAERVGADFCERPYLF